MISAKIAFYRRNKFHKTCHIDFTKQLDRSSSITTIDRVDTNRSTGPRPFVVPLFQLAKLSAISWSEADIFPVAMVIKTWRRLQYQFLHHCMLSISNGLNFEMWWLYFSISVLEVEKWVAESEQLRNWLWVVCEDSVKLCDSKFRKIVVLNSRKSKSKLYFCVFKIYREVLSVHILEICVWSSDSKMCVFKPQHPIRPDPSKIQNSFFKAKFKIMRDIKIRKK